MSQQSQQSWSSQQHPIGSPFGAAATAGEVLEGVDLRGRSVVVTGGHQGIGFEVTRALAGAGAEVLVGARSPERAAEKVAGIAGVEVDRLDLVDPGSVDAFVGRRLAAGRPVDVLVNCAAVAPPAERTLDADGHEIQFATSHLGPFRLTLGLLPLLRAARGARVVNVSSGAQRMGAIRWDDPDFTTGYHPGAAYAQAKRANVLFAVELDRRWAAGGVRGYAVHPGVVIGTSLNNRPEDREAYRAQGLLDEEGRPVIDPEAGKKTPAQGAATVVFAAASPLLDGIGGVYLKDCEVSVVDGEDRPLTADSIPAEVHPDSIDPEAARRLWELTEQMLAR
ncbi:SDR family NAD(P)-dependent oxidoreductase [Streptomyces sp. GZWMJZ-114]|uniref:SDR family NAD(P)-dependent oxidoreductase n=1 Tax=Streptomyces sp. GZWMJZ-114 TaxID=2494734 RepID=UPI00101392DB|nr:SDR family NAD(P)-dependent oxidoreductase [Streptomyces sp. GZWMJZ-114]